jgi:non-ribosomal peptide synthetase component F
VVAGRPHELDDVKDMVGLFINTLPVRVKIDGATNLLTWLRELQANQVEIRRYEHSRLADLERWADLPPHAPLLESVIRFQNFPVEPGSQLRDERPSETGIRSIDWWHYPLCLIVVPGVRLWLRASYSRQQFDRRGIKEIMGYLRDLLEGMAGNLSELSLEQLPLSEGRADPRMFEEHAELNSVAEPFVN